MYTSIALVALVGFPAVSSGGEDPRWLTDYSQAKKQGESARKPLAVFLGTGEQGYARVSQGGKLSAAAQRLLADHYVCVYLDTESQEGKRLASGFQVTEATGLVLSDRTGGYQAFRYGGTLSDEDLTRSLKRFADPERVMSTTVTSVNERVSYYPSEATGGTTYPAFGTPYAQPGYGGFGGFGGGFGGGGRGC